MRFGFRDDSQAFNKIKERKNANIFLKLHQKECLCQTSGKEPVLES